jgi:thrombospondin type 3 repeat protein
MKTSTASAALAVAALLALPGVAGASDRNHDGISDRWERNHDLSLAVNQANRDQDRDGLGNLTEFEVRSDPRDRDTDNDGVRDGAEDADRDGLTNHQEDVAEDDPANPDTDGDGIGDGDENSGQVASFDGATLTINLLGGGQLTGAVTDNTRIRCRPPEDSASGEVARSHGGPVDCTAADIVAGEVVHEAELRGPAEFDKVDLIKP